LDSKALESSTSKSKGLDSKASHHGSDAPLLEPDLEILLESKPSDLEDFLESKPSDLEE